MNSSAGGNLRSWLSGRGITASAASALTTPWPIFSSVSAASILAVDFAAAENSAMPHRLDAHPGLRIVLHRVPMLGEPKCGRRGDLRRRRRRARTVHVDDVGAVDLRPRHVRRIGAERRLHLARPARNCLAWCRRSDRHRRGRPPSPRTPRSRAGSGPERRCSSAIGTKAKLLPPAVTITTPLS